MITSHHRRSQDFPCGDALILAQKSDDIFSNRPLRCRIHLKLSDKRVSTAPNQSFYVILQDAPHQIQPLPGKLLRNFFVT